MAIAYRAGTSRADSVSPIVINKPAGVVAGDVMYLSCLCADSTPSLAGWTAVDSTRGTPTNGFKTHLLRRVADGSEGASFSFTLTGPDPTHQAVINAYSGVDNTTPEDATVTAATGTTAAVAYPSITTVTNNAYHVAITNNFNALPDVPSGYTDRTNSAHWAAWCDKAIATAGAVSGVAGTSGGNDWVARSLALRPAGAGAAFNPVAVWMS